MNKRDNCRLCNSKELSLILQLTPTPPANEFVSSKTNQECFPLDLYCCHSCQHYQLLDIVDPSRLFKDYVYVSGTSSSFVNHFRNYACSLIGRFNPKPNSLVVDIGSNDGTLLRHFKNNGLRVFGIDPATKIAEEATSSGIPTLNDFFNQTVARAIKDKQGKASLITANNVFAHIDDLNEITLGVKELLDPKGVFSFEVSYFKDVVNKTLFDTIYHEHLSYHTVNPLIEFFKKFDLTLFDVELIETHGGSIRCFVGNSSTFKPTFRFRDFVKFETIDNISNFKSKIEDVKINLINKLKEYKSQGKSIACYGAPAKATSLMFHFELNNDLIDFIVDDNPLKQGLFSPGKHIPVVPSSYFYEKNPDVMLILAWNFSDSIIQNNPGYKGKWMIPLPELKEINGA